MNKKIVIIGGGTVSHIKNHLALCAPAYGSTAKELYAICLGLLPQMDTDLQLTKMGGGHELETNEDIKNLIDRVVADLDVKIVFMNAALCDFSGTVGDDAGGKYSGRLKTSEGSKVVHLTPTDKLIGEIRKTRKDIFLVGFKTTCGATLDEQYLAGLGLLKTNSCNLVVANDTKTRMNMIITPEEARYHVTNDRTTALYNLVQMVELRSHLTFTRSTVIAGNPIPWESDLIPKSLRTVVDYCVSKGAYKPFMGKTAGHFAVKLSDDTFLTSIRKSNFNDLSKNGLVKIVTDGPDTVLAYGSKPSVGGQSQRIVFSDHKDKEYDCIVHFHCPIKEGSEVPVVSQRAFECGSHECGQNTSDGLKQFGSISAVHLDNHGPNIVFNHSTDPQEIIAFIEANFILSEKTGGMVS